MSITQYRERYKPFEYEWCWDIYKKAVLSSWNPLEVSMNSDLVDWANSSEADKKLIGGILRAFTLVETFVSCYWGDRVCKIFPKHEIVTMARYFSSQEGIHAWGYSHLSDTLGIDEWEAYQGDPTAQAKVAAIVDCDDDVVSLGVFSGAVEGISLMSSFVVLLSYTQKGGRFRGLNQILSWSTIDENNHSMAGCRLFRELDKEGKVTQKQKQKILEGFDLVLKNEEAFLRNAYDCHPNPPVPLEDILEYLKYRATTVLKQLGITAGHQYNYQNDKVQPIIDLFESLINGNVSVDFFSSPKNGAGYVSKPANFSEKINWVKVSANLYNDNFK